MTEVISLHLNRSSFILHLNLLRPLRATSHFIPRIMRNLNPGSNYCGQLLCKSLQKFGSKTPQENIPFRSSKDVSPRICLTSQFLFRLRHFITLTAFFVNFFHCPWVCLLPIMGLNLKMINLNFQNIFYAGLYAHTYSHKRTLNLIRVQLIIIINQDLFLLTRRHWISLITVKLIKY